MVEGITLCETSDHCFGGGFLFLARKTAVFLAKMSKISLLARNRPVFLAEVRDICYICMI
jgi:hypothetical protein